MILITDIGNPNALKIILATYMANKNVDVQIVDPKGGYLGRLPVLKIGDATLICMNASLHLIVPADVDAKPMVDKWLEWEVSELQPALVKSMGKDPKEMHYLLKELDSVLKDQEYLHETTHSAISIVDLSLWSTVWSAFSASDFAKFVESDFPFVGKWAKFIEHLGFVQKSLSDFKVERGAPALTKIQSGSWFPKNPDSAASLGKAIVEVAKKMEEVVKEKEDKAITKEELAQVKKNLEILGIIDMMVSQYPVLPKKGERNILITSALPYVNNVPHLGNIIGCVLSADVFARYCRQRNYNTLYISGTDEYGTATETKALQENTTPRLICDKYFEVHNEIYRWFGIGFDQFGRTATPEQEEVTQEMFLRIKSQGYIVEESVDQLLCEKCERFLADRLVEGICPDCKYDDARGDQCDGCGHLINAVELIEPRCKICNNKPVVKPSMHFFIDLPKLEKRVKEWAVTVESGWSNVARSVTKPWLRDGLNKRCITRDLKWGVPVPVEGFENKVFYVWFDAPLGYLSITKKYTKEYEKWWKPEQTNSVELYQFMAKDNVPFHAIMFPATLLAANAGHIKVKHIMATEYLNYEDTKFSKSRGIGVFGNDAKNSGIPSDVWRFYLVYIRPETQDSNFNWTDLATKNNSELLNNLGNFINRTSTFTKNNYDSKVPAMDIQEEELILFAQCQRDLNEFIALMEQAKLRDGLKMILSISKHGNVYMQSRAPWTAIKGSDDDKKKAATVLGVCINITCLISALLGPFMPETSRKIRAQLGLDASTYGHIPKTVSLMLPAGHVLGEPSLLFSKITAKEVEELRKQFGGKQE